LDEDLTEFEKMGKLYYFPIVQAPDENWNMGSGKITPKMIEAFMPPKSKLLHFYSKQYLIGRP
jgi:hypothetical protein